MTKAKKKPQNGVPKTRCGLCRKTRNLTKADCCQNWICDDEDKYVMFSTHETAVIEIITITRCAPIITTKNMSAIDESALNAGAVS
jgi:hypothetical protein